MRLFAVATAFLVLLAGAIGGAGAASKTLPQQDGVVDLLSQANLIIHGAISYDRAGTSAAGAGDVNGDGRSDLIVGAPDASNNGRRESGSARVVFGAPSRIRVDLAALGEAGFRIDGVEAGDNAGGSVAGAGDVNGDGRSDVIVGAWGTAYVVFGKASSTTVDLAALGDGGFRIVGFDAYYYDHNSSVARAGDVNGDGRADLVVGSAYAGRNFSGSAFVVFGKSSSTTVDLTVLGDGGFRIDGAPPTTTPVRQWPPPVTSTATDAPTSSSAASTPAGTPRVPLPSSSARARARASISPPLETPASGSPARLPTTTQDPRWLEPATSTATDARTS